MSTLTLNTPVHALPVASFFAALSPQEKLYAHHLSRAAWSSTRVTMNQVSPESEAIFDFIMEVHSACGGDWVKLQTDINVSRDEVERFLEYAASVCCNLGNYHGEGDQKFVPDLTEERLRQIASISERATKLLDGVVEPMLSSQPSTLGFDGPTTQTSYYPSPGLPLTPDEVARVDRALGQHKIEPENTRIRKAAGPDGAITYQVLIASTESQPSKDLASTEAGFNVRLVYSDHARALAPVVDGLRAAAKVAPTAAEAVLMQQLVSSFTTGDMQAYRESQKTWVGIRHPRVEITWGFIEPYRDPAGVRCEWQSEIRLLDEVATARFLRFGENAERFTTMLPWAKVGTNNDKGEFEPVKMDIPSFTILHALATCNTQVWEASNLPNYSDIKQTHGSKNLLVFNRMQANTTSGPSPFLPPALAPAVAANNSAIRFATTAIHELLGHATGKLMSETEPGVYNFELANPPVSPLTNEPITTWYKHGETWTGVMGKFAASAEECRAMLVSYYLVDSPEILDILGIVKDIEDFIYHTYLMVGVWGINALRFYDAELKTWTQAHARTNFAILRHLLADAGDLYTISHDPSAHTVHVSLDRTKILSHGRPSLGRMLCKIHVWRCSANIAELKPFYEGLSTVDDVFVQWHASVLRNDAPRWKFVHASTVLQEDGSVALREFEASNAGVVQSFAHRFTNL